MVTVALWCSIRTPVPGGYRYTPGGISVPPGGEWLTDHPPLVGDHLFVQDHSTREWANCRVVERSWSLAQYGSSDWRLGEPRPTEPSRLTLIVEAADGPYRDEVPDPAEETP